MGKFAEAKPPQPRFDGYFRTLKLVNQPNSLGSKRPIHSGRLPVGGKAIQIKALAGGRYRGFGQIHAMAIATGPGPLQVIGSGTDSDFQHFGAMKPGELSHRVDHGLDPVPMCLDLLKPLPAQRFGVAGKFLARATRFLLPIGAYSVGLALLWHLRGNSW